MAFAPSRARCSCFLKLASARSRVSLELLAKVASSRAVMGLGTGPRGRLGDCAGTHCFNAIGGPCTPMTRFEALGTLSEWMGDLLSLYLCLPLRTVVRLLQ